MIYFSIIIVVSLTLAFMTQVLMTHQIKDREKNSMFECGFDLISMPRLPFSTHFFLISLVFLIFDVEVALISPFPMFLSFSKSTSLWWSFVFIFIILVLGLMIEWLEGSLSWSS